MLKCDYNKVVLQVLHSASLCFNDFRYIAEYRKTSNKKLYVFNSFMMEFPIIEKKPVYWFAEQISGLVSLW